MGLWQWIWDRLIGGRGPHEPPATAVRRGTDIAVMEPPPESDTDASWWRPEGATRTEPAPVERPPWGDLARALENRLAVNLSGQNLDLPPLPQVPHRVLQRLRDPHCDFGDLVNDIAEDQVIAASVLRLANSPLYRGRDAISTLPTAVTRIGAKALKTLMLHQSLRSATLGGRKPHPLAERIWHRSLVSAIIMRELSRFTRLDAEDAFLIGLLHDIGSVVVLREVSAQASISRGTVDTATFEYLCHQSHEAFGELLAGAWGLPAHLKALIADHHRHPPPDDPLRMERLQIMLADMLTAMLAGDEDAAYDLPNAGIVQDLGMAERNDFYSLLDRLPELVDEYSEGQ